MVPIPLPFENDIHALEESLAKLEASAGDSDDVKRVRKELAALKKSRYASLTPWETVLVSRHPNRPQTLDYLDLVFEEFIELHGDRAFGDDRAIRTGFARIDGMRVLFVGHQKGRTLAERQQCFYGCTHPEGYRKAQGKMKIAAKYQLPVICFIDTPGAYPGVGSEERNQSEAIARNLFEMATLRVPIVSVVIGEGGSGGALAIGVCDRLLMLQYSTYSVISPEGCASILWKSADKKEVAAEALNITAARLKDLGLVDEVLREPLGGAHRDPPAMAQTLEAAVQRVLLELEAIPTEELLARRDARLAAFGVYSESPP